MYKLAGIMMAVAERKTKPVTVSHTKLSLSLNWAPRHEGVLEKWRYSSTHPWPRQLHAPAALSAGKEPPVTTA